MHLVREERIRIGEEKVESEQKLEQMNALNDQLKSRLKDMENSMQKHSEDHRREVGTLRLKNSELEERLKSLQDQNDQHLQHLQAMQQSYHEGSDENATALPTETSSDVGLDSVQQTSEEVLALRGSLSEANIKVTQMSTMLADRTTALSELQTQYNDLERHYQSGVSALETSVEEARLELGALNKKLLQVHNDRDAISLELNRLRENSVERSQWNSLEESLEILTGESKDKDERILQLQNDVAQVKEKLQKKQQSLMKLMNDSDKERETIQSSLRAKEEELEGLLKENDALRHSIHKSSREYDNLVASVSEKTVENEKIRDLLLSKTAENRKEVEQLQSELLGLKASMTEEHASLQDEKAANLKLNRELRELTLAHDTLSSELLVLKEQYASLSHAKSSLESEHSVLTTDHLALTASSSSLEEEVNRLQSQLERVRSEHASSVSDNDKIRSTLASLSQVNEEAAALRKELTVLRAEAVKSDSEMTALRAELARLQEILQDSSLGAQRDQQRLQSLEEELERERLQVSNLQGEVSGMRDLEAKYRQVKASMDSWTEKLEAAETKVEDTITEARIADRKNQQLIKDLNDQVAALLHEREDLLQSPTASRASAPTHPSRGRTASIASSDNSDNSTSAPPSTHSNSLSSRPASLAGSTSASRASSGNHPRPAGIPRDRSISSLEARIQALEAELLKKKRVIQFCMLRVRSQTSDSKAPPLSQKSDPKGKGKLSSLFSGKTDIPQQLRGEVNAKMQEVFEETLLQNIDLKRDNERLRADVASKSRN
jgi:chromosome segregation ATPase